MAIRKYDISLDTKVRISNITTAAGNFANLPNNLVVNSQTGVGRTNGANQKTVIVLRPNGVLSVNVPPNFSSSAYVCDQFEWAF